MNSENDSDLHKTISQRIRSNQRKRNPSTNENTKAVTVNVVDDDGPPESRRAKNRRVNPEKLAERLGPDLVREMEVYIQSGAMMPNFAIRKELQERYQVDRRHLYDYFHARGLRVAKEDRHCNLARSRQAKAKAKAVKEASRTSSVTPSPLPPSSASQLPKKQDEIPSPQAHISTPSANTSSMDTCNKEDQSFAFKTPYFSGESMSLPHGQLPVFPAMGEFQNHNVYPYSFGQVYDGYLQPTTSYHEMSLAHNPFPLGYSDMDIDPARSFLAGTELNFDIYYWSEGI
ncbi:hypothetical protein D9758_002232 [Tetrapyrgos nigripes]|uniref:Uncharacterized protein n=1 Tax=Tetrapyrgos nigripes TaxID=182062 RepID=A0A8H5GPC9_9AGAR|nr:hypothetical protein D9758_002232 [Tetrapyrgos nigripes]